MDLILYASFKRSHSQPGDADITPTGAIQKQHCGQTVLI